MSIKRVTCPGCKQSLNVPASMASTKCPSCGTVFSPANPTASQSAPARRSEARVAPSRDPGRLLPYFVVGAVASLALMGLLLLTFLRADGDATPAAEPPPERAEISAAVDRVPADFQVVDLPESTRKKIYSDYRGMIASSFGKSKRIPKSGAAGQALDGMLKGTVDREITRMALVYQISEDDILQIVAEGDAKNWSGDAP